MLLLHTMWVYEMYDFRRGVGLKQNHTYYFNGLYDSVKSYEKQQIIQCPRDSIYIILS